MYNYNFLNDEWHKSLRNNLYNGKNIISNSNNMNMGNPLLVTPTEGYNRGNMFADLYDQYKNYRPVTLRGNTDQERLFLELSRMCFAAHEINLYLDLNPNDVSMIRLFNDYREKTNELVKEYESKYGPLNTMSLWL
jgi:hypothetical protein